MNEILKSTIGQGYSDELREKVWNQLVQTSPKPSMMTKKRIEKVGQEIRRRQSDCVA